MFADNIVWQAKKTCMNSLASQLEYKKSNKLAQKKFAY
jgi:hypothetical protein